MSVKRSGEWAALVDKLQQSKPVPLVHQDLGDKAEILVREAKQFTRNFMSVLKVADMVRGSIQALNSVVRGNTTDGSSPIPTRPINSPPRPARTTEPLSQSVEDVQSRRWQTEEVPKCVSCKRPLDIKEQSEPIFQCNHTACRECLWNSLKVTQQCP